MRTVKKKLKEIATIEYAKAGTWYPAGSVLIQLAASDGEVRLHPGGLIDPHYAVIQPMELDGTYLYHALCLSFPDHYRRTKQGINYSVHDLPTCPVWIHPDEADRQMVCNAMVAADQIERQAENELEALIEMKKFYLAKMMI